MSTTIDQRVAELRFDNSHFEKNVSTTMSTLDKLKEKLNFTGASKGLSDISDAARKVDMGGLASGVETVKAKFSALEVMGVTALANITNSAVNAGKRIVKSLTIDPITTGWSEYELKMNSVQTIMASTGASIETVNKYLNELNEYSDKTIYSFSDMTQNIGKFTNAGVALEDAVLAMKGISNEAALSGANANEASRAMYNLAQSMSMGYVQYIDWKSIENANMATVSFKEELIKTALELDAIADAGDGMYTTLEGKSYNMMQMFKDGMKDQWLTTDVLITTLKKYASETTDIGAKAYEAATKVKTFSHMLDTLKEAAQSGWAQTWEILFGDFEEGTTLWTGINKVLGGIIDKMSDVRNALAKNVFYSNWEKLTDKIEDAGASVEDFQKHITDVAKEHGIDVEKLVEEYGSLAKAITKGKVPADVIRKALKRLVGIQEDTTEATKQMTGSLEEYEQIATQVINGVFGNGETRVKKLTEAGYDWAYVQNIVNERLGSSVRHVTTLTEEQIKQADTLVKLNDETLKSKGYTDEQIEALRDLQKAAEDSGSSINDLINDLERPSGRELVIDAFSNAFEYFGEVLRVVGDAWNEVFGDIDVGQSLYNVIERIHEFTESLNLSQVQAENFKNIMKGIFDGISITTTIFSRSLTSTIKLLDAIFDALGTDMLTVAGEIGKIISSIAKWIKENTLFMGSIGKLGKIIAAVYNGIRSLVTAFWELERVQAVVAKIKDIFADLFGSFDAGIKFMSVDSIIAKINTLFMSIEKWIKGIDTAENVGTYIIEGLAKGLTNGTKAVIDAIMTVATGLFEAFCGFFKINSPSKLMIAIGGFIIAGLINGIVGGEGSIVEAVKGLASSIVVAFEDVAKNGIPYMVELVKTVAGKLIEFLGDLDLGTVIATGMGVGMLGVVYKMTKVAEKIVNPLVSLDKLFGSAAKTIDVFRDSIETKLKAAKIKNVTTLIKSLALTIGVLAGSLWLISKIPAGDLERSGKALAQLVGVVALLGLAAVGLEKLGGFNLKSLSLVGFAATIFILAVALDKMASIENMNGVVDNFLGLIAGIAVVFMLFASLTTKDMGANLNKAGTMFMGLSIAILIMAVAMKKISDLGVDDITKGMIVIGLLELFFIALVAVSRTCLDATSQAGGMLIKMAIALLLIVGVIKLIGMLDYADIAKALPVVIMLELLFTRLVKVSKTSGEHAGKAGIMMLGMAAVLLAAAICIERIGSLDIKTIGHGLVAVGLLTLFFGALIKVSQFSGEHAAKAGAMLLMVSGALLMLTGVIYILGKIPTNELWKAVGAIAALEFMFGLLIAATYLAKDVKMGVLITLVASIGVLVASLLLLSYVSEDLPAVTRALVGVMMTFAILIVAVSKLDSTDWWKKLALLATVTAVVAALGIVIGTMANKIDNPEAAVKSAEALGVVMLTLSGALIILTRLPKIDGNVFKSIGALAVLGVVAGIIGVIMGALSKAGLHTSMADVLSLSVMLLAMSGVLIILDKFYKGKNNNIIDAIGGLIALSAVVGVLQFFLGGLGALGLHTSMSDVLALSVMLAAMSGVLIILNKFPVNSGKIYKSIAALGVLGLVVAEVGYILGELGKHDMHASLEDVFALSVMLGAMSGVLILLGATSAFTDKAWLGIAGIAALGLVVLEIGLILQELKKNDMMASVEDVKALSIMLLSMSAALVILSAVGLFAGAALAGMGVLAVLIGGVTLVLEAFGALTKDASYMESIKRGAEALSVVGRAIGDFVGSMMAGFADAFTSKLPEIASRLSEFMNNLGGFMEGAESIDQEAVNGVKNLVEVIAAISSIGMFDGLKSAFGGGSASLETFAANLNTFGNAMVSFSDLLTEGNFQGGKVKAAASAAEMIAALYEKLPKTGGLFSGLFGTADLGKFATQLAAFGGAIVGFSQVVSAEGAIDEKAVKSAAKCGEFIAELQNSLPETGGVIQNITGMKDLGKFGENLVAFGTAIVGFSRTVSAEGAINQEAVEAAKAAGDTMAALQDSLPACEGLFKFFGGKQDLGTFGTNIEAFGNAIVAFSSTVSAEGAVDAAKIEEAKKAGIAMTEVMKAIPEDKLFDGKMSLSKFGDKIESFGSSMKTYSERVSGIDATAISNSTKVADDLVKIAQKAVEIDEDKISNFSKVKSIGVTIADYAKKVADIDAQVVSTSITAINKLVTAIGNMSGLDTSGVSAFKEAVSTLGETNIKDVVKAFSNSKDTLANIGTSFIENIAKGIRGRQSSLIAVVSSMISTLHKNAVAKAASFQQVGNVLMVRFASGITSGRSRAVSSMSTVLSSTVSSAKNYYWKFYSAGTYLVDGFAAGITTRTWKAAAASAAMANAAEKAAKEALDINSPSKVFRAIAYSIPEGFAMGIDKMSYLASDSAYDMAAKTIRGVKDAIARISDYMNEDVDSQPTIRPVVDLSDVKTGVAAINGIFGQTQSIGVMSNVRSINSMMNQRGQNGVNDDVVSAIDNLRRDIGNVGGTTNYTINGVNVGNDEEVATAFQTIIRAIRVEGRA